MEVNAMRTLLPRVAALCFCAAQLGATEHLDLVRTQFATGPDEGFFIGCTCGAWYGDYDASAGPDVLVLSQREASIYDPTGGTAKAVYPIPPNAVLVPAVVPMGRGLVWVYDHYSLEVFELSNGVVRNIGFGRKWKDAGADDIVLLAGGQHREPDVYVCTMEAICRYTAKGVLLSAIETEGSACSHIRAYRPAVTGEPQIVCLKRNGAVELRDRELRLVRAVVHRGFKEWLLDTAGKIYEVQCCNWQDIDCFVVLKGSRDINVLDTEGNHKAHVLAPYAIFDMRAASVKLDPGAPPYLAVVSTYSSSSGMALLIIFSTDGSVVYQETLKATRALCAIPQADGTESLLVGDGKEVMWLYSLSNRVSTTVSGNHSK